MGRCIAMLFLVRLMTRPQALSFFFFLNFFLSENLKRLVGSRLHPSMPAVSPNEERNNAIDQSSNIEGGDC